MPKRGKNSHKPRSRTDRIRAPTPPGLEATDKIRTAVITALFSIDAFHNRLVLKGGNALRLVYKIQERTSLDLDFSLDGDFYDIAVTRKLIFWNLRDRLDSAGYYVFDESFDRKPPNPLGTWGGYLLEFKVVSREDLRSLGTDLENLRRRAIKVDSGQKRIWRVEISKHEHCEGKVKLQFHDSTIFVYTPEMIVIEKLRALCQQLPNYPYRITRAPRARDFFDIHEVMRKLISPKTLKTQENCQLARAIFNAKAVPLALLSKIQETRDFHAPDWASVRQATLNLPHSFDYYFDFVAQLAQELKAFWIEDSPSP